MNSSSTSSSTPSPTTVMIALPEFWLAVFFTAIFLCLTVFALVYCLSGTSCHRWYARQQMQRAFMQQLDEKENTEFEEWLATQITPPPPPPTAAKSVTGKDEV